MNQPTNVVLTIKLQSSLPKFANHCVHGHPTICCVLGIVFHFLNIRYIYLFKLRLEKRSESEFGEVWVTFTRTLKIYGSTIGVRSVDVSYSCAVTIHALD